LHESIPRQQREARFTTFIKYIDKVIIAFRRSLAHCESVTTASISPSQIKL
jgi:hypothetical protein